MNMGTDRKKAKKVLIIVIGFLILLCAAFLIGRSFYLKNRTVKSGLHALVIAEDAFFDTYGETPSDVRFVVEHNVWNGTWHVFGIFLPERSGDITTIKSGGTPEAIIREWDGKIIRIWHTK